MRIDLNLIEIESPYGEYPTYLEVDFKPFLKIKFPNKQKMIQQLAFKNKVSESYIKKNFKVEIDVLYQNKLIEYSKRKIVSDIKFHLANYIKPGPKETDLNFFLKYDKDLKTFIVPYSYKHNVKNFREFSIGWPKWVDNYYSNKKTDTKCPFTFGDKKKIEIIEDILKNLGIIDLCLTDLRGKVHNFKIKYELKDE
jgi:hypothetical protein